jgi:hypothetical protein
MSLKAYVVLVASIGVLFISLVVWAKVETTRVKWHNEWARVLKEQNKVAYIQYGYRADGVVVWREVTVTE